MNRREALSRVSMIMGGTIIGASIFLKGCKPNKLQVPSAITGKEVQFLDEVGETILPATMSSPGAKEARIGEFMKVIVEDCYEPHDQQIFIEGIMKLDEEAVTSMGSDFMTLTPEERKVLLIRIDKETRDYMAKKKPADSTHYFAMLKQLTLWGYFSSEVGATKALRYVEIPGRFQGCTPYDKGNSAWAF